MSYYVYILFSDSINKYYIGYSKDPWIRLKYHNSNETDKYTGKGKPWNLCAVFLAENKTTAISCERFIKKQKSKMLIEKLCNPEFKMDGKLAQLVIPYVRDTYSGLIRGSHSVNTE